MLNFSRINFIVAALFTCSLNAQQAPLDLAIPVQESINTQINAQANTQVDVEEDNNNNSNQLSYGNTDQSIKLLMGDLENAINLSPEEKTAFEKKINKLAKNIIDFQPASYDTFLADVRKSLETKQEAQSSSSMLKNYYNSETGKVFLAAFLAEFSWQTINFLLVDFMRNWFYGTPLTESPLLKNTLLASLGCAAATTMMARCNKNESLSLKEIAPYVAFFNAGSRTTLSIAAAFCDAYANDNNLIKKSISASSIGSVANLAVTYAYFTYLINEKNKALDAEKIKQQLAKVLKLYKKQVLLMIQHITSIENN